MDTEPTPGTREAYLVDAFTAEPLSGNAAGVLPNADGLSDDQMQAIARELSVSETAFLFSTGRADRRVRYFTPTTEVDLCGHATIAAHATLHATGRITPGTHSLETNVGVLEIELTEEGRVWMTQDQPTVRQVHLEYDRLAEVLGCPADAFRDVGADMPTAVASTGLPFLIVPVNFLEHLGGMDPDMGAVEVLTDEHDAVGIYAFTFDALEGESTLHGRMFAPGAGVPEDPVTGTASGACGAYLRHVGAFTGADPTDATGSVDTSEGLPEEMVFEQGHFVERPGSVRVQVGEQIRVGGQAVTAFEGQIMVPEYDTDDIIQA